MADIIEQEIRCKENVVKSKEDEINCIKNEIYDLVLKKKALLAETYIDLDVSLNYIVNDEIFKYMNHEKYTVIRSDIEILTCIDDCDIQCLYSLELPITGSKICSGNKLFSVVDEDVTEHLLVDEDMRCHLLMNVDDPGDTYFEFTTICHIIHCK